MKNCNIGKSCGATCIAPNKECIRDINFSSPLVKLRGMLTEDQKWERYEKVIENLYRSNMDKKPEGTLEELAKATVTDLEKSGTELMEEGSNLYWTVASVGARIKEKSLISDKEERGPITESEEDTRDREAKMNLAKRKYNLTQKEAEIVSEYAFSPGAKDDGAVATSINNRLRSGGETSEREKLLISALGKLPANTNKRPHYRVESYKPSDPLINRILGLKQGDTIKEKGFSSYSRSKDIAEEYRWLHGSVSVIYTNTSKNLRNISEISRLGYEKESILPPGSLSRVVSVKITGQDKEIGEYSTIEVVLEDT